MLSKYPIVRNILIGSILVALIAVAIAFVSSEENRLALRSDYGYLSSGAKFDVKVGSEVEGVPQALQRHYFKLYRRSSSGTCLSHDYDPKYRIDVFSDDSWRRGTVCVVYDQGGRVRHVEWSYAAFSIEI